MSHDMIELQIAASSLRDRIPKDQPLEARVEFAMRQVNSQERDLFWMTVRPSDDLKLRTALAAVMLAGDDEDRVMIERSLKPLKAMSALISGVPVDFEAIDMEGILPLMKLYNEAKEGE